MHRVLSLPAAERLLISVRSVSYLHVTQVVSMSRTHELWSLACNKTTQYHSALFLRREKLYVNHRKLQCFKGSERIYLYINQCLEVLTFCIEFCGSVNGEVEKWKLAFIGYTILPKTKSSLGYKIKCKEVK